MAQRLGIDIGGTFTDAMLIDETTGAVRVSKVSSTPQDPSIGFMEVAERILREAGVSPSDVTYVVHGTTVATNAIIEGKVARAAFVTTEGFRDMLEIARQIRPVLYDLQFEKPKPLVPRYLCFGVRERLDAQGNILVPLEEGDVREAVARMRQEGVESVAVCFLHSYANPEHERRTGEIIEQAFPDAMVSLSSDVAPEFREYFRASTTVINAAIRPVVGRYLESIEERLRDRGLEAELLVMQSSGGVFTFAAASEKPVFMVESGPAAGVIATTNLGASLGHKDMISFDMGGTTAKVGMIRDGAPQVTKDYEVGAAAQASVGATRGKGYPIRTPVIDLVEIGAGGGSIAWVDSGGVLRVGPQSAGADPGPVCYGKGGSEPTITDANLVLGRLNPDYFLGGEMKLDVEAARRAIQVRCADKLGLDVVDAAYGIVEIANAAMINALRLVSVQRGYDPRDFALVAFGGAGPVHANRLAAETEIATVIVPMSPGVFSAMGLLVTDLKHDYSSTLIRPASAVDVDEVEQVFQGLERRGREALERERMTSDDISYRRSVDTRYVGQSYELSIPLPPAAVREATITDAVDRFHKEHNRAYGFSAVEEPVEIVNLRLTAVGRITKPAFHEWVPRGGDPEGGIGTTQKAVRPVYFAEAGGFTSCQILDRYLLAVADVVGGPAIIEEVDSTTVVHPGYRATVDRYGNLVLTRGTSTDAQER